jgi:dolichol-phosphate mannosyltransferase
MFAMARWSKDKTVSIIISACNKRDNIIPLVKKLHDSLAGYRYEIVFIDNNSGGAAELVSTLSQKYAVKSVVRKNKRGLASTVADWLRQVNCEMVVVMDADSEHPPEVVPSILQALESHDLVVASRYRKGDSPRGETLARRLASYVANLLALPLAPGIKDRMSGFFGFRPAALDLASLNAHGSNMGLEVVVRGCCKSVTEIPYTPTLRTHGASEFSKGTMWQYLQQLVQLYFYKFRILNFMLVGGIGYAINMLIYWLLTPVFKTEVRFLGQHFYLPPFVISSLIAIVCNYELNKVWTFRGWKEQRLGSLRYLSMALVTLSVDIVLLYALVEYFKLSPVPAAAIAILIVFIVRYAIASRWVWSGASSPQRKHLL